MLNMRLLCAGADQDSTGGARAHRHRGGLRQELHPGRPSMGRCSAVAGVAAQGEAGREPPSQKQIPFRRSTSGHCGMMPLSFLFFPEGEEWGRGIMPWCAMTA